MTNQNGTVYALTFQGKFIGVADDAKQLSIGQTSAVKDYYPSFVANNSPEPVFDAVNTISHISFSIKLVLLTS